MYMIFFDWEIHVVKHKKVIASHKEQTAQVNDFSAFLCMEEFGVIEILP